MLLKLKIKNIALIDECVIEFGQGFNVLTGETGAGKSIIIDSLNFVLGARSDKTLIKKGCDSARVEGVFEYCNNEQIDKILTDNGIDPEGMIIISRNFNINNKNECRINGEIVTLNIVKKISNLLVDVFGQNDNQILLDVSQHINVLDSFKQDKIDKATTDVKVGLIELKQINDQIKEIGGQVQDRQKNIELLEYQIDEIENANIQPNEDELLLEQKQFLLNSEKISNEMDNILDSLNGKVDIYSYIKNAINSIKISSDYFEKMPQIKQKLEDIRYDIQDIVAEVENYKNSIDYSDYKLDEIEDRLQLLNNLKRKYGNSIELIFEYLEKSKQLLDKYINADVQLEQLNTKKYACLNEINKSCLVLTNIRNEVSVNFENQIVMALRELGMKNAQFKVNIVSDYNIDNIEKLVSLNGADKVEFLFSANLGQPVQSLNKIISGGEMSRFMLAVKSIIKKDQFKTNVFDEIDTGIGGEIGGIVGKKMAQISKYNQVLAVTHLAQIACYGDINFNIIKFEQDGQTFTQVKRLDESKMVDEITRMIGSLNNDEFAKKHAVTLIEQAKVEKSSL